MVDFQEILEIDPVLNTGLIIATIYLLTGPITYFNVQNQIKIKINNKIQ